MLKGMVTVEDPVDGNKTASAGSELGVVTSILSQLSEFDAETRERIIQTVATFYGISLRGTGSSSRQQSGLVPLSSLAGTAFSEDRSISPKQFMFEKQPRTDVEKVACLAYYLTHYKNAPHFKTLDISKLNTDAAQVKFSNPTVAVENAVKTNYLVPATKGNKQLSAIGEQFVQALPDRERAKGIMANARPRRKARRVEETNEQSQES
ncbi:MAG: hypothetical protein WAM87_18030 [Terriglobales bacterium]